MERAELSEALRTWRSSDSRGRPVARTFIAEVQPEKFMTGFVERITGR